jgi:hypothetical protein
MVKSKYLTEFADYRVIVSGTDCGGELMVLSIMSAKNALITDLMELRDEIQKELKQKERDG